MLQKLVVITGANERQVSGRNGRQVSVQSKLWREKSRLKGKEMSQGASDTHDLTPKTLSHSTEKSHLYQKASQAKD